MLVTKRVIHVKMKSNNYFNFEEYTGNFIRSALIEKLRSKCCTNYKLDCYNCTSQDCVLKNTFIFKENNGKLQLNPIIIDGRVAISGDIIVTKNIEFSVSLLGKSIEYSSIIEEALQTLEFNNGKERERFRLVELDTQDYTLNTDIKEIKYNGKIRVVFESYVNVPNHKSKFTKELKETDKLQFNNFVRACTHRVTSLVNTCSPGELFDYKKFTEKNYNVMMIDSHLEKMCIHRKSSRTKTESNIRAIRGYVEYSGDIDEAYDLIKLVSELHIGKYASLGLGKFTVEMLDGSEK